MACEVGTPGVDLVGVQRAYREEKEKAIKAIEAYMEVNKQMLSKLYVESGQILQHDSDRFAETNTSLE